MKFGGTLWEYYAEFIACVEEPNVLVLVFEDMQAVRYCVSHRKARVNRMMPAPFDTCSCRNPNKLMPIIIPCIAQKRASVGVCDSLQRYCMCQSLLLR